MLFFLKPAQVTAVTYNKSGFVTAGTFARATDTFEATELGTVVADTLLAGADVHEAARTGAVIADTSLGGTHAGAGTTTGKVLAGTFARAADVFEATENGVVVADTVLAALNNFKQRTGTVAAYTWVSAPDVAEHAETGKVLASPRLTGFFRPQAGPAGKFVITNAYVTVAGVDVSRFCHEVVVTSTREQIDVTPFGNSYHEYMPGPQDGEFTISLFADPTITTPAFWALMNSPVAVEVHPRGSVITATNPSWTATAIAVKRVPLHGQVGEAAETTIQLKAITEIIESL